MPAECKDVFVKPQIDTSFPLAGVIGCKAVVWNDFRWPHPPLGWGDMLNVRALGVFINLQMRDMAGVSTSV